LTGLRQLIPNAGTYYIGWGRKRVVALPCKHTPQQEAKMPHVMKSQLVAP